MNLQVSSLGAVAGPSRASRTRRRRPGASRRRGYAPAVGRSLRQRSIIRTWCTERRVRTA